MKRKLDGVYKNSVQNINLQILYFKIIVKRGLDYYLTPVLLYFDCKSSSSISLNFLILLFAKGLGETFFNSPFFVTRLW